VPDISDVAGRVTRDVEHRKFQAAGVEFDFIALAQPRRFAGQALAARPEQRHASVLQQAGDAADVIGVVMSEQDAREREVFLSEGTFDRCGVAGIDGNDLAGITRRMDQPDVVVGKCPYWRDLQHLFFEPPAA
jgi:hypothetical protein